MTYEPENSQDVIDLFNNMSVEEANHVYAEVDGNWVEFHFDSNGFYYVLKVQPFRGIVKLWSDEHQKNYTICE